MEGIVFGIAQINFQQTFGEVTDKNSKQNWLKESSANMASSELFIANSSDTSSSNSIKEEDDVALNSSSETAIAGDDSWKEAEEDVASISGFERRRSCTFSERRQLPHRASKETSLLGIKRRTIMKPTKRSQKKYKDFNNLKPADIRKIYLNKKLTNFRPSSLETIFEEPVPSHIDASEEDEHVRLIGARKIKRSLSCCDGTKHNKTLVNKRRAKIKKTFGKRFALKKISLEDFLDKLNSSMENDGLTTEAAAAAITTQCDQVMIADNVMDDNQDASCSAPNNDANNSL